MKRLEYLGHASIKLEIDGKVIYVDPYAGEDYSLPADLVLITHGHYDHADLSRIKNKDYRLISHKEALLNGKHQEFDLGYIKIKAVEAGYNSHHNAKECVGYLLFLNNGVSIYIPGDTGITPTMKDLASLHLDYAFIPMDGFYTMNEKQAKEAATLIGAKHVIPYHTYVGKLFDIDVAKTLDVENRLILKPGEFINLD